MKRFILGFLAAVWLPAQAADNLVVVTIDGLRWQEVFRGLDHNLANNTEFSARAEQLESLFGTAENSTAGVAKEGSESPAEKLMPFFHGTIAKQGQLYGNRDQGDCMQVSNPWYFSYPGYNEILTGKPDPAIDTNGKIANPNVTFLEWLNQQTAFRGKVYAFGSWDVFPYIINEERSGVPVNAGFEPASGKKLTAMEKLLNQLQQEIPSPWKTVRLDAFTHHFALEQIKKTKPRVVYIAYGETDDFAHDGHYDQYVLAAHRTDAFIAELWQTLQSMGHYRDNTNLIVTTDHGRGSHADDWQHHASKASIDGYMKSLATFKEGIVGSNNVWFAAMGPDIQPGNTMPEATCASSSNIAATAIATLGLDWNRVSPAAGASLPVLVGQSAK